MADIPGEEELKRRQELLDIEKELSKFRKDMTVDLSSYLGKYSKINELSKQININTERQKNYIKEIDRLNDLGTTNDKKKAKNLQDTLKLIEKEMNYNKTILSQLQNKNNLLKAGMNSILNGVKQLYGSLNLVQYLTEADQAIRDMGTDMGLVGKRFEDARTTIVNAAGVTHNWGMGVKELTMMQAKYSDILGKNVLLSKENYVSISKIAAGTALGVDGASEMVGQFTNMGVSVKATQQFVEGTVKSSMLMGVNTGKVLKDINKNLKQAQKFTFKGGIKALSQMAIESAKFGSNIESAFTMVDKSRTLEGAIDMATQLQLMGGAFGQADAFKMLHNARNDVNGFEKDFRGMLKGISRFNKESGQLEIASPVNRDIIDHIAKTTGRSADELIQMSHNMAKVGLMQKHLYKFDPKQKEFLETIATMNGKGEFEITVGDETKKLAELNGTQVNELMKTSKGLEALAEQRQGVAKKFENAMLGLKSSLLPLLINLTKVIDWIASGSGDDWIGTKILKAAGIFAGISFLANPFAAISALGSVFNGAKMLFGGNKVADMVANNAPTTGGGNTGKVMTDRMRNNSKNIPTLSKDLNTMPSGPALQSKAAGIAAIGVAAVGIGAGIWMAAKGLAELAKSFKDLTGEQSAYALGAMVVAMGGFAIMLKVVSTATIASAEGLGILAIAALAIGGSIWMAGQGIGYMVGEMSKLTDPNIGTNLAYVGAGMIGIGAAANMLGNPLALLGLGALTGFLYAAGDAINFKDMKDAFTTGIQFAQSATQLENVKNILAEMAEIKLDGGGMLSELHSLLNELNSKGIKVNFEEGKVRLENNITLNMDRDVLIKSLNLGVNVPIAMSRTLNNK
jgi:hypothetical protein